jgi:hypothetical protein
MTYDPNQHTLAQNVKHTLSANYGFHKSDYRAREIKDEVGSRVILTCPNRDSVTALSAAQRCLRGTYETRYVSSSNCLVIA